jgi:uncharacterized protein YcbX
MIVGSLAGIWRYAVKSMGGEGLEVSELGPLGIPGDRGWALRDERAGEIRNARKLPELLLCRARYPEEPGVADAGVAEITLPEGTTLRSDDPRASEALSELVGRPVTLWPRRPAQEVEHYLRGKPDRPDVVQEIREVMDRLPDEPLPDFSAYPRELARFACPPGTYFDSFPLHVLTTASLDRLRELHPSTDAAPRRFRPNLLIATEGRGAGPVEAGWCGRELRMGTARLRVELPTVRCAIPGRAQRDLKKDAGLLRTIVRELDQNLGVYASILEPGRVSVGDPVQLV